MHHPSVESLSVLDAALAYIRAGYSVIPLKTSKLERDGSASKRPYLRWVEFQERRATEEEVKSWWTKWPDAGIGLVCGAISGLVVVDFDARNGADLDLTPWEDTLTVTSPGGMHLYYAHPGGHVPPSVGVLGTGLDVRGDGSYIVAPPTVRADGGKYVVADPIELVQFPYMDRLTAQEPTVVEFENPEGWAETVLREGAGEGGRNDTLARLAGIFAGKGLPESVARETLKTWAVERCNPPMDVAEVAATVRSIYLKEKRRKDRETAAEESPDGPPVRLLRFMDFLGKYGGTEIEWLIPDWIPKASIGFVVSPPECFKSWLTGEIAVSLVTQTPLLGQFSPRPCGPVFVLQQEDHHGQTAERYAVQIMSRPSPDGADGGEMIRFGPDGIDNLLIQEDREFHFGNDQSLKRLEAYIEEYKPSLVIIDPLYACVDVDDAMVRAARQMKILKNLRDKHGTTFLLVHHAGKSKTLDFDRERAWGSQFLNAFVEFGVQIGKVSDTEVLAKRHFKMCSAPPFVSIDWCIDTRGDDVRYSPNVSVLSREEADEIIGEYNEKRSGSYKRKDQGSYEVVEPDTIDDPANVLDAIDRGFDQVKELASQLGITQKRVRNALKQLSDDGRVGKIGSRWSRLS